MQPKVDIEQLRRRMVFSHLHAAGTAFMLHGPSLDNCWASRDARESLVDLFEQWHGRRSLDEDLIRPPPAGALCVINVAREVRYTIRAMLRRSLFPHWLMQSKDRGKARTQSSESGYYEAGNMAWEALYWLGGLYMLPFGSGLVEDRWRNMRTPTDAYGTGSSKSSKGFERRL